MMIKYGVYVIQKSGRVTDSPRGTFQANNYEDAKKEFRRFQENSKANLVFRPINNTRKPRKPSRGVIPKKTIKTRVTRTIDFNSLSISTIGQLNTFVIDTIQKLNLDIPPTDVKIFMEYDGYHSHLDFGQIEIENPHYDPQMTKFKANDAKYQKAMILYADKKQAYDEWKLEYDKAELLYSKYITGLEAKKIEEEERKIFLRLKQKFSQDDNSQ